MGNVLVLSHSQRCVICLGFFDSNSTFYGVCFAVLRLVLSVDCLLLGGLLQETTDEPVMPTPGCTGCS